MVLEINNRTAYRIEDLRALFLACLRYRKAVGERRVTVIYSRGHFTTACAQLARGDREGRAIRLRVPRPERVEDMDRVRLRIVRVIDHEIAHTVGLGHRVMAKDLRRCVQDVPWADGLELRIAPQSSESELSEPGVHGGRRQGAGRPRLGRGETVQIALRLPRELLSALDRLTLEEGLKDRSEAIRRLVEKATRGRA